MTDLTINRPIEGDINVRTRSQKEQGTAAEFLAALDTILNVEGVEAVKWDQYTPYFNDGEPCEFSVYDYSVKYASDDLSGDGEDGFVDSWSFGYPEYRPEGGVGVASDVSRLRVEDRPVNIVGHERGTGNLGQLSAVEFRSHYVVFGLKSELKQESEPHIPEPRLAFRLLRQFLVDVVDGYVPHQVRRVTERLHTLEGVWLGGLGVDDDHYPVSQRCCVLDEVQVPLCRGQSCHQDIRLSQ